MVADFVSADYGWLRSKDGKESARVIFRPGKNRDGYFDNNDILAQTQKAMGILSRDYSDEDHVFIFDNATTHLKRAEDALSAHKMPKFTPKEGMNWGVKVTMKASDGSIVYDEKGKPRKMKIRMCNGKFLDGRTQEFYFPKGHPRAGIFKSMAQILRERGYTDVHVLRAECPKFKCDPLAEGRCCCRRLLFNEPDFATGLSILEILCKERNFQVLFLPKFHCELNFIEQDSFYSFARRSRRFMDAYHRGLSGKQAAWAGKMYHGHCVLPDSLMKDMEVANLQ
ncbi:MAG: hypothetical protein NXY57DRAFT_907893 [Lentinula lateritia]|nr:MAG: hypothetical protein NXY57DRAFT_907893 [Lentinula lateritia]